MIKQTIDPIRAASTEFSVLFPKSNGQSDFYVPPVFFDTVMLHIIKNALKALDAPLMLAIQGPKGEGKSRMSREVCSQLGIIVVALPGASLSGIYEKEPLLILREAYLHASALQKERRTLVALLIDDIDTSIASTYSERRYTVNTQLLNGALMYLCDDPYHIGEQETSRIPLIVTGNDFTSLHEPLTRHGRAQFLDWKPEPAVRTEIVRHMFRSYLSKTELAQIERLVNQFEGTAAEPLAFYIAIRGHLYDHLILRDVRTRGAIDFSALDSLIKRQQPSLTVDDLIAIGESQRNNKARSYGTVPNDEVQHATNPA